MLPYWFDPCDAINVLEMIGFGEKLFRKIATEYVGLTRLLASSFIGLVSIALPSLFVIA
jgi:hypothetical protein